MVVGDDGTNGGLWCSPVAKTSRPTSSALRAIATMALIRSCSVGVAARGRVGRDIADGEDSELHSLLPVRKLSAVNLIYLNVQLLWGARYSVRGPGGQRRPAVGGQMQQHWCGQAAGPLFAQPGQQQAGRRRARHAGGDRSATARRLAVI